MYIIIYSHPIFFTAQTSTEPSCKARSVRWALARSTWIQEGPLFANHQNFCGSTENHTQNPFLFSNWNRMEPVLKRSSMALRPNTLEQGCKTGSGLRKYASKCRLLGGMPCAGTCFSYLWEDSSKFWVVKVAKLWPSDLLWLDARSCTNSI